MLGELDTALFYFINRTLNVPALDPLMVFITSKYYLLFLLILVLLSPKYRSRLVLPIALALLAVGLSDAGGNLLKHIFERPRPFQVLPDVVQLVRARAYSFPSSHASNAFAFAVGISYFIRKVSVPMLLVAALAAYSRMYVGVHYPFDVFGGMLWGTASFFIVLAAYNKIKALYETDRYYAFFCVLLPALFIMRLYYIQYGPLDLIPDEAHYWEWSRRLDLSYYSKGPVIAYLIALTTNLGGNNVFSLRLPAPFLLLFSSVLLYKLSLEMFGNNKAGILSGLLLQIVPLFATFGVIMTIDPPFLFLWCLALLSFWRAVAKQGNIYWYITGLIIGFGFMAKYIMLFFFICAFFFLLFSKEDRYWLKSPHPYLASLLGLLACSPVVIWNYLNGWVTLLHTAGHAHVKEGLRFSLKTFLEFAGSQIGIITPFLSGVIAYVLYRYRHAPGVARERTYLLSFSLPVLLFFLVKSMQAKVEANWALVAYPALFVLASFYIVGRWKEFGGKMKAHVYLALAFAVFLTLVAHFPSVLGLPPKMDPTTRMAGWKELGIEASRIYDEMAPSGPVFVFSDSYQIASELAFYMEGNPVTYCINLGRRMNQYDLWPGPEKHMGHNAIYVKNKVRDLPEALKKAFAVCEQKIVSLETRQKKTMKFTFFKCYDFKGIKIKQPESY